MAKSYALRLLIHYLGDLHQPFHTTARFSDAYPDGDKGANLFPIPYHYEADEMHAVWDKGVYELRNNIPRPISDKDWTKLEGWVNSFMSKYKYSLTDKKTIANRDIDGWSLEMFARAKTMYKGATENEPLPQAYIDESVPKVEDDITLGGYRLAYLITYIFDKNVHEMPTFL